MIFMGSKLGEELKRNRLKKQLSLLTVSQHTNMTPQYLSMIERGDRTTVSFQVIIRLCKFYDIDLNEAATWVDLTSHDTPKKEV